MYVRTSCIPARTSAYKRTRGDQAAREQALLVPRTCSVVVVPSRRGVLARDSSCHLLPVTCREPACGPTERVPSRSWLSAAFILVVYSQGLPRIVRERSAATTNRTVASRSQRSIDRSTKAVVALGRFESKSLARVPVNSDSSTRGREVGSFSLSFSAINSHPFSLSPPFLRSRFPLHLDSAESPDRVYAKTFPVPRTSPRIT